MRTNELYPFSTSDGQAIPLDILRPVKVLVGTFVSAADTKYSLTAEDKVALITASEDAILSFAGIPFSIVMGTPIDKALFLPKNVSVVTALVDPLNLRIRGFSASGTMYVQVIEKWAGLALDKQTKYRG